MVFEPDPEDLYLTKIQGCLVRLRLFDQFWQQERGIFVGDQIVCMDLDSIVTGPLDDVFRIDGQFAILQGANRHKFRFNGSIWSLTAGFRPDIWHDFCLDEAHSLPFAEFPDDQQYIEAKLGYYPKDWMVGSPSGIYAMGKPGWPKGDNLPEDARLVVFPGHRDPSQFTHLEWVKKHWV